MADDFFIMSIKWTRGERVTWWRPDNAGYTDDLMQAGRYPRAEVEKASSYYDNKWSTLAIPCEAALKASRTRVHVDAGPAITRRLKAARYRAFRGRAALRALGEG